MDNTLFDRIFKDDEGNIAIAQKPNLPLIVWLVATVFTLFSLPEKLQIALDILAFGSIFTWAWLELFQGVNYFRRSLGLIVLTVLFASKLSY